MQFKITEIKGVNPAQYGQQRVSFKVENNPATISGFFATLPNIGDVIEGDIIQKPGISSKTGQPVTYHNFIAPKIGVQQAKTPSTADLYISRSIDAFRADIGLLRGDLGDIKGVLGDILQKLAMPPLPEVKKDFTYPKSTGPTTFNEEYPMDEINPEDVPF